MNEIIKQLGEIGIIPVVAIEDAADAAPLGEACCRSAVYMIWFSI